MSINAIATDNEIVDPGTYVGTLEGITTGTGPHGPTYEWRFAIDGPNGEVELKQLTTQAFSPASHARQFAEALLGRTLSKGANTDLESLVGMFAELDIKTNERGYSSIEAARPYKAPAKARPAADTAEGVTDQVPF